MLSLEADIVSMTSLMRAAATAHEWELALQALQSARTAKIGMDYVAYNTVLTACARIVSFQKRKTTETLPSVIQ